MKNKKTLLQNAILVSPFRRSGNSHAASGNKKRNRRFEGAAKYKSSYKTSWEYMFSFVTVSQLSKYYFYCTICRKDVSIQHQGIKDVARHADGKKHKQQELANTLSAFGQVGAQVAMRLRYQNEDSDNIAKSGVRKEGLESWTTSSGISSLIESLEGCSAAATTTSIAPSRTIVSEELPSFSFTSVKSPTPFKKAYVESEHADGILKSLSWLWRTNKLCDAVICSGETKIMLHRLILFAVSPHLLEKNIRDGAELEVNLPSGINDEALATFVAFLYDGVLNLTEYNYKDIERVGNLLRVEKVQRYCREFASSLAEYKLHQQLPMPVAPVIDGGNHEYVGKRKRGRPSKQTVVLNLGDEHSLGDRLDPSHYLQSGELSNYHNMSLSGSAISRMNSDMPVVFPDSQEYCLPSTSQTAQLFPSNQGNVKTEPYQQSQEFCSPFRINPKGSKSNSKEDADHISSFVMHETSGKSSTTMDIQTTTTNNNSSSNNNNGGDEDNNSTTANNSNNNDNGKNSTSEKNSNSKSNTKSLGSPSKGDGGPSETLQSSPYSANVVASSGDGFSLYSLASS